MPEIRIDNEKQLIKILQESDIYKRFKEHSLPRKCTREEKAWALLNENRGKYSLELLNKIFDTVDYFDSNKRWFGHMLATPNRNWIFESSVDYINKWIEVLLANDESIGVRLNRCLKEMNIRGASKGLATLILYLSDPKIYNIWVNTTQQGLNSLGRIPDLRGTDWGNNYTKFNDAAIKFRDTYGFLPQELDWIFTFFSNYLEAGNDYFTIDEDVLKWDEPVQAVDDEAELDEVVGEPLELGVMRWAPTNEMGVVALFIEFRKELGFPIIEIIRSQFPDAIAFEAAGSRLVRKYIEFEYKSSGFKSHLKSKRKCHYVICWEHNWRDCPVQVIELRSELEKIMKNK